MAQVDELKQALDAAPVDATVKRQAWNAFAESKDPADFASRMKALKLPANTVKTIQGIKYPAPPGAQPQFGPGPQQPAEGFPQGKLTGKDVAAMGVSALPMAGGFVGSIAGGVPGAIAGGAIGETAREGIVGAVGPESLSGPTVQTEPNPEGLSGYAEETGKQGAIQGAMEVGAKVVSAGLRGAAGGALHSAVTPEVNTEAKAIETATENAGVREASDKAGLGLTAPQIAGKARTNRLFNAYQRAGEYSIFSQKFIQGAREAGIESALKSVDEQLDKLALPSSPLATGEAVRDQFRNSYRIFQDTAGQLYQTLNNVAGNVRVNVQSMKQWAANQLAEHARLKTLHPQTGGLGGSAEKILQDAASQPDELTFYDAQKWRSKLGRITPQTDELAANEAQGIAKQAYKVMSDAMDNSANMLNPKAQKVWKVVNRFYKDGMEVFDAKMINHLMDQDKGPELIASAIKDGDVSTATRIRRAVLDYPMRYGNPADKTAAQNTWRHFQEQFTRSRILGVPESIPPEVLSKTPPGAAAPAAKVHPLSVKDVLDNAAGMQRRIYDLGPGVLDAVYADSNVGGRAAQQSARGKETIKNLNDIANAFARIEKLPIEGRRYIYAVTGMALAGIGATAGGAEGGIGGAAVGTAVAEFLPNLIAWSVHSPAMTRYMLDGIGGAFKSAALKGAQELTITSPTSYKIGGKLMANFGRMAELMREEQGKMKEAADKAADKIDVNPYRVQKELSGPPEAANPYE